MAGPSSTVSRSLLEEDPRAGVAPGGLLREIGAIALFLLAVFVALSLVVRDGDRSLTGPVGLAVAEALRFVFGHFVAWTIPLALGSCVVMLFRRVSVPRASLRALGVLGLAVCACAWLALPGADEPLLKEDSFRRGGLLGVFLVNAEGLGLSWQLGTGGAILALAGGALVSFLLATDLLLITLLGWVAAPWHILREGWGGWRERRRVAAQARLAGEQSPLWRSRLFSDDADPVLDPEHADSRYPARHDFSPGTSFDPAEAFAGGPDCHDAPPLAPPAPAKKKGRWNFFGWGTPAETLGHGALDPESGASAADAMGFGLPGRHAARASTLQLDPDLQDEVVDEEGPADIHPTIVDGFSPLPVSETGNTRGGGSLWGDEDPDQDDGDSDPAEGDTATGAAQDPAGRSGPPPPFPAPGEPTAAEARMLRRLSRRPPHDPGDAPDPFAGSRDDATANPDDADDDPLFEYETADVAKRMGIAAATGTPAAETGTPSPKSGSTARGVLSDASYQNYRLPAVELLDDPPKVDSRMPREELLEISETLEKTLNDFGIQAKVIQVVQGPVVTRFELKPAAGVKVSRITSLEQDISMAMRATNPVRILAPIPGKAAVGIEVPNRRRAGVYLKELISTDDFWCHKSPLAFALGKTIEGDPYLADLSKMPHLLIAGATGAGKSVCVNAIICSILYRMRPDQVKFLFVDPKRVELALYQDIPHLLAPVVSDAKRAAGALAWAVEQMEERYETLVEFGQRNIDGYNALVADPTKSERSRGKRMLHMPHMVIVLDELADLMVVAKNDVEEHIQRLAQMARAVGIHLIVATQRPSVNVITGVIKANFPARIAFQVSSKADSRVIMDTNGAETLLGRGDMLFHPGGAPKPQRVQGCFVSEAEVERLVSHIKSQAGANYVVDEFEPLRDEKGKPLPKRGGASILWDGDIDDDIAEQHEQRRGTNRTMGAVSASGNFVPHGGGSAWAGDEEIDEALVRAAARLILENRKASVSLLQRRLKVGFSRAGRLMDMLEEIGIVGPFQGSKPRDILVDPDQLLGQMDEHEAQQEQDGEA